jgi:hypothetical protein
LEKSRGPSTSAHEEAWPWFVKLDIPFLFHLARRCGLQTSDVADLLQAAWEPTVEARPAVEVAQELGLTLAANAVDLSLEFIENPADSPRRTQRATEKKNQEREVPSRQ